MMEQIRQMVSWRKVRGDAITLGDTTIFPTSQALSIRLPFGGFVWNRPTSVEVTTNGESEEIAIVDVTRVVLMAMTAITLAATIIARPRR